MTIIILYNASLIFEYQEFKDFVSSITNKINYNTKLIPSEDLVYTFQT